MKFLEIKEGGPNFSWKPILQKVWIIWSTLLYFNFKSFEDSSSWSFIRFQCIVHDSGVVSSESWNFYKLKRGDLISEGNQFCRESELFGPPLLYLNFKSFVEPNSSSFIRFQCIVHDSGVLFTESWNSYKLKRGDLISGGSQFCRKCELFGPPFFISVLKVLRTQIFRHSLDFNALCMMQDYFSQSLEISTSLRGGTNFVESLNYLFPSFCSSILKVFLTQILFHSLDFDAFCMIKKHFSQSLEISSITRGGT